MENSVEYEEEKEHFKKVVAAFRHYRTHSISRLRRAQKSLSQLPAHHQKMLTKYKKHLDDLHTCIEHNHQIVSLIIKDVDKIFENVQYSDYTEEDKRIPLPTVSDMEKLQSTLRQFVREWSSLGETERKQSFQLIMDEIETQYPADSCDRVNIHVLNPGAGLGRLAYDIAKKGFTCQGNEFSLFMLFASNFMLNKVLGSNSITLYPFIHQYTNNLSADSQKQPITVPDVDQTDIPANFSQQFSMAAGDFLEVYTEPESWDCVATCFFLDCANNIVEFIERIYKILKNGGVWINVGPLLYHFSDIPGETSIEPSYEDIREIIKHFGFVVEKERLHVPMKYSQNPESMLQYEYNSVYFVCRKHGSPLRDLDKCEKNETKMEADND